MGCGPQETFINCADIKIINQVRHPPNVKFPFSATGYSPNTNAIFVRDASAPSGRAPLVIRSSVCVPKPKFETRDVPVDEEDNDLEDMWEFCQKKCLKYPPAKECSEFCECP